MQSKDLTQYKNSCQEEYLRSFFMRMQNLVGKYSVLHSYDTLPVYSEGDIDIAVKDVKLSDLEYILCTTADQVDWEVIHKLWYDIPVCMYYVLRSRQKEKSWLAIDFLLDEDGIGYTRFDSSFLTNEPIYNGIFSHSNPNVEFCYKLTKRIWKGYFKEGDTKTFNDLFKQCDISLIRYALRRQYGRWGTDIILHEFSNKLGFSGKLPHLKMLAAIQHFLAKYSSPIRLLKRFYWQSRRVFGRVAKPSGLVITIPGLSIGELTILRDALRKNIGPAFRKIEVASSATLLQRFSALSKSTLLLCAFEKNTNDICLYQSIFSSTTIFNNNNINMAYPQSMDTLASILTKDILKVLRIRVSQRICATLDN